MPFNSNNGQASAPYLLARCCLSHHSHLQHGSEPSDGGRGHGNAFPKAVPSVQRGPPAQQQPLFCPGQGCGAAGSVGQRWCPPYPALMHPDRAGQSLLCWQPRPHRPGPDVPFPHLVTIRSVPPWNPRHPPTLSTLPARWGSVPPAPWPSTTAAHRGHGTGSCLPYAYPGPWTELLAGGHRTIFL